MMTATIKATIFYSHKPEEVQALADAIVPMRDHIRAVASGFERGNMNKILSCEYFRAGDAMRMRNMLSRAANYARAHLEEYFPAMRQDVMRSAEELEQATKEYWKDFLEAKEAAIATQ
jgi:hypothetical protein